MNVFKFGVFFYGGLVYGLDCWVFFFVGLDLICDCIVFLKNNFGCDVMLDVFVVFDLL